MLLTIKAVDAAKPREKEYKIADGDGMYLLVYPTGKKAWKLKYRMSGKEKKLHLGNYPEISLKEARDRRHNARKLIGDGLDPSQATAKQAQSDCFKDIAQEWHATKKGGWSERHGIRMQNCIDEVVQQIGHLSVGSLTAPDILPAIRAIESRQAYETARKALMAVSQVCQYAVITGRAGYNAAHGLSVVLQSVPTANYPHLKESQLPEFLRGLGSYEGEEVTKLAVKFLMMTFVRPENVRFAEWGEFDVVRKLWNIPPEKMKVPRPHIVPLTTQALAILERMRQINGKRRYVFSEPRRDKPMSENTILFALYRMGYKGQATAHGFRHTASTILNEHGFSPDAIERQLAHVEGNKVRAAYNHAQYMQERIKMMQWYSDHLDSLRAATPR